MSSGRTPVSLFHKRPYFFEVVTIASLIAIALLWHGPPPVSIKVVFMSTLGFIGFAALGLAIRALLAWRRKRLRALFRIVRSPRWITDTIRICFISALAAITYAWIKISIPLIHPRLYDAQLWNIDRALFFGYSPNVLFVTLFSHPLALRTIDFIYANVFLASINFVLVFSISMPDRIRLRFLSSNTLMWLGGAWLYMLVPSLGPAYRFPDIWLPLAPHLAQTQQLQRLLMANYQSVLGSFYKAAAINLLFGIAAFPSLHVAFEMLTWLWMRKLWPLAGRVFAVVTIAIFIGSVVTGWHYLIDSLAGLILAALCYAAFHLLPNRFERRAATD